MQKGNIQIYESENGKDIHVKVDKESLWLDAHLIASLFNVKRPTIVKHIQNIYKSEELNEKALTEGFLSIISQYSRSFALLSKYDSDELSTENLNKDIIYTINYSNQNKSNNIIIQ